MKVCILGYSLTSLTLAKALVNQGVYVDIFFDKKNKKQNKTRTIGISKSNLDFFNRYIININKISWKINKIEIYRENLDKEQILNFENHNENLFSIVKNYELFNLLEKSLKKNKLFCKKKTLKKKFFENYELILNCDLHHEFTKKFFYKKIIKNYKSYAYTTILKHKNLLNNDCAIQIFTNIGPLAYLPISKSETSVVYSINSKKNIDFKNIVRKFNFKFKEIRFDKVFTFPLKSLHLRSYYHGNILAFGEVIHKIHPLAGQGFNMILRDIKSLVNLIIRRKKIGLELDYSICSEFENKTKHKNFVFAESIDFIYEFFNFENKIKKNILSKSLQYIGKKKFINKYFKKFADKGFEL